MDEVSSNVEGSLGEKSKERKEKFMPFAKFLLKKYNLDLFYFSLEFLFLTIFRWMLEFIFRIFILFFLICFILKASFINFNRNFSTCCELKFIYIFITVSNFLRLFWYL